MKKNELLKRLQTLPKLVSRIKSDSVISGAHKPLRRTRGDELDMVAVFRPGIDDFKSFAPKASARMGKLMRKKTTENKDNTCYCLIDTRPSMLFGNERKNLDFAVEVAGIIGLSALAMDDKAQVVAMPLTSKAIPEPEREKDKYIFFLNRLYETAYKKQEADIDMRNLRKLSFLLPSSTMVFIISNWIFQSGPGDKLSDQKNYLEMTSFLRSLLPREVGLIVVNDPLESTLPDDMWNMQDGLGQSAVILTGGSNSSGQKILLSRIEERRSWLQSLKRRHGIDYCELESTLGFGHINKLMTFFAQRSD